MCCLGMAVGLIRVDAWLAKMDTTEQTPLLPAVSQPATQLIRGKQRNANACHEIMLMLNHG